MFNAQVSGYVGKQFEKGFIGYVESGPCYILLSVQDGFTEETGKEILENVKEAVLHADISSLSSFENIISSQIFKQNLPAHFSLAAGYLHDNHLYVKTVGDGEVYYRRGKEFAKLIAGDKSAAGQVQEYDCAVFTTGTIKQVLGETTDIQLFVDMNAPKDIFEKLQNEEYDEEERGFAAIFVEFTTQAVLKSAPTSSLGINPFADVTHTAPQETVTPKEPPTAIKENTVVNDEIKSNRRIFPTWRLGGSKKIALLLAIVLFGILLWSVVFGYERRAAAQFATKVEEAAQNIEEKLQQAEKEAFLNLDTSLQLLTQSKEELASLKAESEGRNSSELSKIEKRIQQVESGIVKKEEKTAGEFYDLALEIKEAVGSNMYVEEDTVAILDSKNKTVYLLSLDKKAIEKYTASELKDATLVTLYEGTIYFFNEKEGIFRFNTQNKVKKIITADTDWGMIADLEIFNGNLYLLDSSSNEIYKYTPTESGYADKTSYITAGNVDFSEATGLAIDASIYVSSGTLVQKFTRGSAEKFETEFPEKSVSLSGIYTDEEMEQVFTWDKNKSVIYILEKDGGYVRQIQSSILKSATDFFVYGDAIYVLSGSKLYQILLK